jgi:AcrR family transcriptional regulator
MIGDILNGVKYLFSRPLMGIKERRERQKGALRQEILDAARELFIREGYDNVSMRKIAERIEYSPTTIYLYFKDKTDLLRQLCEETFGKLIAVHQKIAESETDPVEGLRKGLRAYVDFGLQHPNHYKVTFIIPLPPHHEPGQEADVFPMGDRAFDMLRNAVRACVEQGRFHQVDVETTSQALWAAVHGVTSLLICHADFPWVDRESLIDATIDIAIRGLMA